ncbi:MULTISPECIES: hypothetical protein [unclassified Serratia (in: enterobacteria)]|uniref:hypothetical protein n=1 Tax=unclassified Serratia (in: enterobacteria) TaxID=2647522 RepID=UPI00307620F6
MSKKMIAIQVRGDRTVKTVPSSKLEESANRSLRASFSLEGQNVNDTTWAKMNSVSQYLTRVV